jgi:hypothetical protein
MMLARCCPHRILATFVLLLMPPAGLRAEDAGQRTPVPDAAAQAQAMALVREVFGEQVERVKDPAEGLALARKMLDQATNTVGEPAAHFVLLGLARDLAQQAGDPETALEAVDQIGRTFEVDAIAMKVDCLIALQRAARLPSQHGAVAEQALALLGPDAAELRRQDEVRLKEGPVRNRKVTARRLPMRPSPS